MLKMEFVSGILRSLTGTRDGTGQDLGSVLVQEQPGGVGPTPQQMSGW